MSTAITAFSQVVAVCHANAPKPRTASSAMTLTGSADAETALPVGLAIDAQRDIGITPARGAFVSISCRLSIVADSKLMHKLLCSACGCKSEYSKGFGCNAETGQCKCLPGVVGEKCDQCPYRWVFVPDYGCTQCDSCIDNLLDDMDNLRGQLDGVVIEFNVRKIIIL